MKSTLVAILMAAAVLATSFWLGAHFKQVDDDSADRYSEIISDTNARIKHVEDRQTEGLAMVADVQARCGK